MIVVDDGSSDATAARAESFAGVRCLRNGTNQGKGYSVRRGALEAKFDYVVFTDADLSAPIEEVRRLIRAADEGADLAIGSRRFDVTTTVRRTPLRRLMAAVFRLLVKVLVVRGIEDTQCGFKLFRRDAARYVFSRQRLGGWGFDVELLYIARSGGYRIVEEPVSWTESEQSRLQWHTPFTMAVDLVRIRWNACLGRYKAPKDRAADER